MRAKDRKKRRMEGGRNAGSENQRGRDGERGWIKCETRERGREKVYMREWRNMKRKK